MFPIGWMVGILTGVAVYHWTTRNKRLIQQKREAFLIECLGSADKFPGGREYVRVPYNTFVTGAWIAEHSKHYPRKEYRHSVGVVESN